MFLPWLAYLAWYLKILASHRPSWGGWCPILCWNLQGGSCLCLLGHTYIRFTISHSLRSVATWILSIMSWTLRRSHMPSSSMSTNTSCSRYFMTCEINWLRALPVTCSFPGPDYFNQSPFSDAWGVWVDDRWEDSTYSSGMVLKSNIPAVPPNVVPLNR